MKLADITPALPKLLFVLALLGSTAYLTIDGVIQPSDAYGFLGLVMGATAVAGTIVLSGPQPNTDLFPHVVILLAIIGFAVALGVRGLFDGTEIVGIFSVLIGGGALALGKSSSDAQTQRQLLTLDRFVGATFTLEQLPDPPTTE